MLPMRINGRDFKIFPDTGADHCLAGREHIAMIAGNRKLKPLDKNEGLKDINKRPIPLAGKMTNCELESKTTKIKDTFYFMDAKMGGPPIASEKALLELGYLRWDPDGGFNSSVKSVTGVGPPDITRQYPDVFSNKIGKLKNYKVSLRVTDDFVPTIHSARPIPLHLEPAAKKALDRMVDNEVYEWLDEEKYKEPLLFVSALVCVPKPGKLDECRITADMRDLNRFLQRHRIVYNKKIEDHLNAMRGCKKFARLDLISAYFQLELDEDSKRLCTLTTPFGMLRMNRLSQGLKVSQDFFDERMMAILQGIPFVATMRDDVIIGGRTDQEYNENLKAVLERFRQHGLTCDLKKSQFDLEEISWMGHRLNQYGLSPDPQKIAALKETPRPASKAALLSFICAAQWQERFCMRFASEAAILHDAIHSSEPLTWTKDLNKAFETIKTLVTEECLNTFFDPELPIGVWTDAGLSSHIPGETRGGISAILAQKNGSDWQPVCFHSRRLTDTESRWSQIEVEALAIGYALAKKLSYYLIGAPHFTVYTDCAPLCPLFNGTKRKNVPPRIERQILRTQHLDYSLVHIPGRVQRADFMSRSTIQQPSNEDDFEASLIRSISLEKPPPCGWERIQQETAKDPTLQKLKTCLEKGKLTPKRDPELAPFSSVFDRLSWINGVLYRGQDIVPPHSLRDEIMTKAHVVVPPAALYKEIARDVHNLGHQGEHRTIELLTSRFYWPKCRRDAEERVKSCPECQLVTKSYRQEPRKEEPVPEGPFSICAADYKGPWDGDRYALVIICLYSSWPAVYFTRSTSLRAVKRHFLQYFSDYGTPNTLVVDNGPCFNSPLFTEFCKEAGVERVRHITPRWPKANGTCERWMATAKRTLMRCKLTNTPVEEEITRVLAAYRNTPHPTLKRTPASLIGRPHMRLGVIDPDPPTDRDDTELRKTVQRMKSKNDRRTWNVKVHDFVPGDFVLVDLGPRENKGFNYQPEIYIVTATKGSSILAQRQSDGKTVMRDSSLFKRYIPDVLLPLPSFMTPQTPDHDHRMTLRPRQKGPQMTSPDTVPPLPSKSTVPDQTPHQIQPLPQLQPQPLPPPETPRPTPLIPDPPAPITAPITAPTTAPESRRSTRSHGPAPDLPLIPPTSHKYYRDLAKRLPKEN